MLRSWGGGRKGPEVTFSLGGNVGTMAVTQASALLHSHLQLLGGVHLSSFEVGLLLGYPKDILVCAGLLGLTVGRISATGFCVPDCIGLGG